MGSVASPNGQQLLTWGSSAATVIVFGAAAPAMAGIANARPAISARPPTSFRPCLTDPKLSDPQDAVNRRSAYTSSITVTGPSLTSATPMQAPKTPFFARTCSQKRS